MARQQRTTPFAQESTRPITQVALYAPVSTLNNQDPEMQLSELREYRYGGGGLDLTSRGGGCGARADSRRSGGTFRPLPRQRIRCGVESVPRFWVDINAIHADARDDQSVS